ncbi:carboxypeptidase regulatory-like domain-containing protein [candidate division KSB1 bacterium]|nr:carboxypeptidase regulatory-like domain-containing protein [candidate division KSB1 bacterium]
MGGLQSLEEPVEDNYLIVGNVIVENISQELSWQHWDSPFEVVLLGQCTDGTINHYTVTTDKQGYFCVPNVPEGQYALKAVILPLFGSLPLKIVNNLTSPDSKYNRMRHPEVPIEYTAEWFPVKPKGHIINFDVTWLGLREGDIQDYSTNTVGKVISKTISDGFTNKLFYERGYVFSREDPIIFIKKKFPNSLWWEL